MNVPAPPCDSRSTDATVPGMTSVASRELRNNTRSLLDRVGAGESITITVAESKSISITESVSESIAVAKPEPVAESVANAIIARGDQ